MLQSFETRFKEVYETLDNVTYFVIVTLRECLCVVIGT